MRANDVRVLAESIGNAAQEAAEEAQRLADEITETDRYEFVEDWQEAVRELAEELIATLDLLAVATAKARDEIGASLIAEPGVPA